MKSQPISRWITLFAVATCASTAADKAEVSGKDTVDFEAPVAEETGGFLGSSLYLSGGYASEYLFRGRHLGDNLAEGRAEWVLPIAETASLSIGGKYAGTDDYEEAQGFASLQQGFGIFNTALGYRWYGLDADDRQEVGFLIGTALGGVDWSIGYYYDSELSGHFVEMLGQHTWQIYDHLALRSSAGISATSNYWHGGSGWNNAVFRLDLPVNVRNWFTLTPWISASVPLDAIDDHEDDSVFGGVNLQLSF